MNIKLDENIPLGLFDDFIAYRADLGVGIQKGRLVPFAYHGVRDDIDYAPIPWRNHRSIQQPMRNSIGRRCRFR